MALLFAGALPQYALNISTQLTTNWGHIGAITPELPHNIVPYIESFEIKGHLAIRQTQRALDLIRRSWGWYLNNVSSLLQNYIHTMTENSSSYSFMALAVLVSKGISTTARFDIKMTATTRPATTPLTRTAGALAPLTL